MNDVFEQLSSISFEPIDEQIIEMLQSTWPKISPQVNESAICRGRTTPDVIRTAVYSHINVWNGTMKSRVLDEWMDFTPRQQNALLIRAFPDGRTYDV
jgi:hypothetical protein